MKQQIFTLLKNEKIAKNTFRMVLNGDTSDITRSGQFVNIKLQDHFLRRPISICDYDDTTLVLIYKVVGGGTEEMRMLKPGAELDLLIPLGNGYDISKSGDFPLLIGGGVGIPPLYNLCKKLKSCGKKPAVILGFNSKDDVFFENEFKALDVDVFVATVDGSYGFKGFVTDIMKNTEYDYFFTCGPEPMFRAIENISKTSGQYSFEERMGCGFGACMGCTCKTKYGNKRICKDGPVLYREEIIW